MFDENNRFERLYRKFRKKFRFVFKFNSVIGNILVLVLILFLLLELSSFIVIKLIFLTDKGYASSGTDVFESNKEWMIDYDKEKDFLNAIYYPYIGYMIEAPVLFRGKYLNLDGNVRSSYNPCKNDNSLKIFVFGGSTIWGNGARDNHTIPSFISKKFCERNISVDVTNFGTYAYVNSQEMIRLILELRKENLPDYVIFYDGFNEVASTYENNEAGLPVDTEHRKVEFNGRRKFNLITPIIFNTNFGRIMNQVLNIFPEEDKEIQINKLSEETINLYRENIKIIETLSENYNFTAFYFWQPNLLTKKHPSDNEKEIIGKEDIVLKELYIKTYDKIKTIEIPSNYHNLDNVLDDNYESIYLDMGHISEKGNEIVAESIVNILLRHLKNNTLITN